MRVLIVEDEKKVASFIKKGLQQEGYAADAVYNGAEACQNALLLDYDLVVLDLMLPEKSGLEVLREIRAKKPNLPVLVLTAKGAVDDKVAGLDAGADDYLIKPFAFEELLARVRALMRRPQDHVGNVLELNDLSLDTASYEVKRAGRKIKLSQREYALLEYLMRNQNRTLSKNNIISHVWDYDADILPNTLEVYIGYLRNKIERPFRGPELIHTIRGFGYKLGIEAD